MATLAVARAGRGRQRGDARAYNARDAAIRRYQHPVKPLPSLALLVALLGLGLSTARAGDTGEEALESLRKGLHRPVAEERVAAVNDLGSVSGRLSPDQTRTAALMLRKAFGAEQETTVRLAMTRALSLLKIPAAWVPVILASFEDRDPAVRIQARKAVLSGRADFLEVVKKLLAEDDDPTFRANLVLVLRDRRKHDAVPILLDALHDKHLRVEAAAAEALEAITGEAFGYDEKAWRAWAAAPTSPAPAPGVADPKDPVTVAPSGEVEEPKPHVTRSLVPYFLGLKITAKDVVFVIDVSGSVGSGGAERVKRELEDAVERLGSDVRVAALFFDEDVKMWCPNMLLATPASKANLALFLRGVTPGKRTDVFTPINAGLQILKRRVEEKQKAGEPFREPVTMIVASDGRDNMAKTPVSVIEERLDRLDLANTVVHAIVLGGVESPVMRWLAHKTGGHYIPVER